MFKIAIIGRPNVGKSTLFNKLVGRTIAITDDIPGVTRDRKEAKGKLGPLEFVVIDTAGLEGIFDQQKNKIVADSRNETTNSLTLSKNASFDLIERMVEQTEAAVADADLCLFVVDGKDGLVVKDYQFAQWLRRLAKPIILVANKCENLNEEVFGSEYFKLRFGKPIGISAEHKLGFVDLYEKIAPEIEKYEENFSDLHKNFLINTVFNL